VSVLSVFQLLMVCMWCFLWVCKVVSEARAVLTVLKV
jgi:hypothetical protein